MIGMSNFHSELIFQLDFISSLKIDVWTAALMIDLLAELRKCLVLFKLKFCFYCLNVLLNTLTDATCSF